MSYEVALAGVVVAVTSLTAGAAAGAAAGVAAWRRVRARRSAADPHIVPIDVRPTLPATGADDDPAFDPLRLDEQSQFALTACVFASAPVDHLGWTAMVVDPALHDTPGHVRLVGHYDTELAAVDAAAHLADELNECLVPGEAPLTATALGIESANAIEPLRHLAPPIGYQATPRAGRAVPSGPVASPTS